MSNNLQGAYSIVVIIVLQNKRSFPTDVQSYEVGREILHLYFEGMTIFLQILRVAYGRLHLYTYAICAGSYGVHRICVFHHLQSALSFVASC